MISPAAILLMTSGSRALIRRELVTSTLSAFLLTPRGPSTSIGSVIAGNREHRNPPMRGRTVVIRLRATVTGRTVQGAAAATNRGKKECAQLKLDPEVGTARQNFGVRI